MYLKCLKVTNFRNLANLEVSFSSGTNIFFGSNGSGKTNLLEAIFLLCLGKSHRAANESSIVRQGEEVYRVEGVAATEDKKMEVSVASQAGGRKKVTIDKVQIRIAELYDHFTAVAAGPEDSDVISGPPSSRRMFLDIYLSQFSRKYLDLLTDYQKVLSQKNAALKQRIDPSAYNELLIQFGSEIMKTRLDFIHSLREQAIAYYDRISGGGQLTASYRPSIRINAEDANLDSIKSAFSDSLEDNFHREAAMETALLGPHRDDIYLEIGGLPARTHGSQGEWRTAALSFKLAVYHLLKRRRKTAPMLLLDEIFAELDNKRSTALIESFEELGQVFLTTAVEPPAVLARNGQKFEISGGRIVSVG